MIPFRVTDSLGMAPPSARRTFSTMVPSYGSDFLVWFPFVLLLFSLGFPLCWHSGALNFAQTVLALWCSQFCLLSAGVWTGHLVLAGIPVWDPNPGLGARIGP